MFNKKIKIILLLMSFAFSGICFSIPSLWAGAWVREEGELYSKLSLQNFSSDKIYASKKSRKIAGPDYDEVSTGIYAEYGLTRKWTGIFSSAYKAIEYKLPSTKTQVSGITDLWIYAKRELCQAPFVLSTQFGVKIPMGYVESNVPPLGDGQVDLEGRILMGKSFYPFPGYGNAEVGYRKRNGDFSDEIPFTLEVGVNPAKPVLVKLTLSGVSNRTNDSASKLGFTSSNPNIFDKEYMKLSPAVVVSLKKGISVEAYYETYLSGANTAFGNTVGLGVSWKGKLAKG